MGYINPSRTEFRSRFVLACAALLVSSVALAGFKSVAPADVNLAGTWKLNPDLSDDPQEVMEEKRAQMKERRTEVSGSIGGVGFPTSGSHSRAAGRMVDREGMYQQMEQRLASAEQIDIEQRPDAVTLKTETGAAACDTTDKTQVSTPDGGLADRQCGWDGKAFVIEIKSTNGFTQRDRYALSVDGTQLIHTTELKGGRGGGLTLTRVYDRAPAE